MKWYSPLLLTGLLLVPATPAAGQTLLSLMGGINVASLEVDSSDPLVPNLQSVSRMSIGLAATIPISEPGPGSNSAAPTLRREEVWRCKRTAQPSRQT